MPTRGETDDSSTNPVVWILSGIFTLLLCVIFFMTYFTVSQNELGVVTRFGKLTYVADHGLHFKVPFVNSVEFYRTDIQDLAPTAAINTYTIDNQEVDIIFTVFYRIDPEKVPYIFENNRNYRDRLYSLSIDRLKAAVGQVNVQSIAEKRGELRDVIKAVLQKDALALGVTVTDFQLSDLQYTKAFRDAVNNAAVQKANIESFEYQRQQAEKSALTAKIDAEGKANAQRAQASGSADARVLAANAEATAIRVQGEATAAAIKSQADALKSNPDLVNLRRAERWDGKLPTNIYGSAPIPFLNTQ